MVPATFANGGLINIVGQLRSENPQVWTGFTVLKGIVLDGSEPGELTVDVRRNDDGSILAVAKDDKGRPRYRTTVLPLSHRPPAPLLLPLPKLDSGEVATVYEDGIMFHQAGFQGVKRILCDTDSQFIAQCELQSATVAGGAYETDTMDPVLYDVMHQSAAIWVRRLTGASCLPATAGRFDSYQRPPRDAPFFVVCTNFSKRSANIVTVDVGAYDGAGRCIVLMTAVEAVTSAALNEVFATGVPSEA